MQAPYLLIPVGLGVLLSYFFSHLLLWLGTISKKNHRRFWNVVLLITFLITAILGLLLVVQINFKLEWPVIDKFLSWHVNFGIAMSLVAIIHFLWHFNYYLNLFKKSPKKISNLPDEAADRTSTYRDNYLVFHTGLTATILQVLLLRELTTVFQGNEILMTWTIGIWMVLTGTGSYMGKNFKISGSLKNTIYGLLIVITLIPAFLLILLSLFKNIIFLPGVMVSPGKYILLVTLLLAPICLLSGLLFTLFIRANKGSDKNFIAVYLYEAMGSIIGGVIVSFLLIQWFSILQSVFILAVISSVILYWRSQKKLFIWISALLIITLSLLFTLPVELKLRSKLYSGNEVIANKETYYGNLTVTHVADEYNFFLNGALLFNTGNFIQSEEFVHYAMLQHKNPENILIISGGMSGIIEEVLKYATVEHIDYLEINRQLIQEAKELNLLPDTSILQIFHKDINVFIQNTTKKYDIVLITVPDPSSVQLNRYYTNEFIEKLQLVLNHNAVVIYGLNSTGNYMSDWQNAKLSLIWNTLAANFNNLEIIPGEKDYLIASDSILSYRISELYSKREIENIYVNTDYIDDNRIGMRAELIRKQLHDNIGINTNDKALPVFFSTLKYLSHFRSNVYLFLGIPLLLFIFMMILFKRESRGMYIAGFTGASVEVLLIFVFQIAFGYIYSAIGVLIAVFMTGLLLGALVGRSISLSVMNYRKAFLLSILYLALLFAFTSISYSEIHPWLLWPAFIMLMIIPAGLTGFVFVISTSLFQPDSIRSAPSIYAVDLIGSSMAMIIMTLLIIPVIGLKNACLFLLLLNFIPLAFSFHKK